MGPAHQRLDPGHHVRLGIDDRLITQIHLAARQRVAQIVFECAADLGRLVQITRIETEPAAPVALGRIERQIGIAHQIVAGQSVERRNRHADRRPDDTAAALDRIGLRQAVDDVRRHVAQLAAIFEVGKNDLEFIAAQPADHFLVADDLEQPFGNLFEQRVAGRMAERVVDLFEAVEIEQHDRADALLLRKGGKRGVELFRNVEPVGQPGQRIIQREPRRILGRAALRRDVGAAAAVADELTAAVEMRPARYRPPAIVAFKGAAQRQIVELRLFGQQKRQGALAFAVVVRGQEQVGKDAAQQLPRRPPHHPCDRIGDIGQPPLVVGRPEPAAAAFFVILEQEKRFAGMQVRRGIAALFADTRAQHTEKATLAFVDTLILALAGSYPRWHFHQGNLFDVPHTSGCYARNALRYCKQKKNRGRGLAL